MASPDFKCEQCGSDVMAHVVFWSLGVDIRCVCGRTWTLGNDELKKRLVAKSAMFEDSVPPRALCYGLDRDMPAVTLVTAAALAGLSLDEVRLLQQRVRAAIYDRDYVARENAATYAESIPQKLNEELAAGFGSIDDVRALYELPPLDPGTPERPETWRDRPRLL